MVTNGQQSCLWPFLQLVLAPDVFYCSKGLPLLDQNETPPTMTVTSGSVPWVTLLLFKISLYFLFQWFFEFHGNHIKEHWMAQWWEHSPPTNVAWVQILAMMPYVGWVCCWFSPLLWEVFLWVLQFSPLLKNQHFQIPIFDQGSGRRRKTLWMCYFQIMSYLFIKENVIFV